MSETIVYAVITLGGIGVIAAVILYFVSQKFKVYEDPKIDTIAGLLPGANCGGCGYAGCRALAEAIVKAGSTEGKACPAGGSDTGTKIAAMMGETATASDPKRTIIRCQGSHENG